MRWIKYKWISLLFVTSLCQDNQIATVINKYKVDHTGANTHAGGLKLGFIKVEYSETDYDEISAKTSNNTKVTADIDTEVLALSVAKSF